MDTSQVPPPKPWERRAPRAHAATPKLAQTFEVDRLRETDPAARPAAASSLSPVPARSPGTPAEMLHLPAGNDDGQSAVAPLSCAPPAAREYTATDYNRSYTRGANVEPYANSAYSWNTGGSYPYRSGDLYGGNSYYANASGSSYYGSHGGVGFGTSAPLYASYAPYRNGLSLSPYSSSLYFPGGSSSGAAGGSSAPFSYSFLQDTAEGLGRVSLLLDLNGCFLDRLCDHSSNLLVRLTSLSASFAQLRAYLASTMKRQCIKACEAARAFRDKHPALALAASCPAAAASSSSSASAGFAPEKPPALLPNVLAGYIITVLLSVRFSGEAAEAKRLALLSALLRYNVIDSAILRRKKVEWSRREARAFETRKRLDGDGGPAASAEGRGRLKRVHRAGLRGGEDERPEVVCCDSSVKQAKESRGRLKTRLRVAEMERERGNDKAADRSRRRKAETAAYALLELPHGVASDSADDASSTHDGSASEPQWWNEEEEEERSSGKDETPTQNIPKGRGRDEGTRDERGAEQRRELQRSQSEAQEKQRSGRELLEKEPSEKDVGTSKIKEGRTEGVDGGWRGSLRIEDVRGESSSHEEECIEIEKEEAQTRVCWSELRRAAVELRHENTLSAVKRALIK
ncbi:hypothetical protein BESB_048710 [Besnoitia besnoiti]|uniref:Uncharacterized protein n=1 Tax=Besnoitia besnoiti TaxID=94643 RepID=A0A2A9MFI4_BESBE|nr:hypothetical protein BESB_048710 [Besnoitia besnoiti]PFH36679.1 hypothetical protein BESB_048710 [Besnoitia besnoiti]